MELSLQTVNLAMTHGLNVLYFLQLCLLEELSVGLQSLKNIRLESMQCILFIIYV